MIPRERRPWRFAALADALGLELRAVERESLIDDVGSLAKAGPTCLAAVYDARLARDASASSAGLLLVDPQLAAQLGDRAVLVSRSPKADFARAIELIRPEARPAPYLSPHAVVAPDARIADDVFIGAAAVIGARCRIGTQAIIGAGCVLLEDVEIGEEAVLHPRVVVYPGTVVGPRCRVLAGAVLGAPGFGHARDATGHSVRVPHLGRVVLEEGVEIGANSTVDRATFGETRIRARARLDNLVQVGHNAEIGEDALIAAQSGLSGSSKLGRGALMGGQSGLADHTEVGEFAAVAAKTAVFADVPPRTVVAGVPAMPMMRWRRLAAIQARLPDLWRAILRRIEKTEGEQE